VNTSEYNHLKNFRTPSMKEDLPLTKNGQSDSQKKRGTEKRPAPVFLPPSFCLFPFACPSMLVTVKTWAGKAACARKPFR
jgi:hypothetical protein